MNSPLFTLGHLQFGIPQLILLGFIFHGLFSRPKNNENLQKAQKTWQDLGGWRPKILGIIFSTIFYLIAVAFSGALLYWCGFFDYIGWPQIMWFVIHAIIWIYTNYLIINNVKYTHEYYFKYTLMLIVVALYYFGGAFS